MCSSDLGEAPGGCAGLIEGRMNAAIFWIDQFGQGIGIGTLELGDLAEFEDLGGDGVLVG